MSPARWKKKKKKRRKRRVVRRALQGRPCRVGDICTCAKGYQLDRLASQPPKLKTRRPWSLKIAPCPALAKATSGKLPSRRQRRNAAAVAAAAGLTCLMIATAWHGQGLLH
ncbi:hypothetical protein LZ32DRAFT_258678 [Colletotrichum eremochloae]|nr:hypothetical protein LZ32DRAFT_258678 [Colletotrichum eremochloae]